MCTPSRREVHFGEQRVTGERESRRIAENYKHMQRHTLLKMCTPSMPEAHFGVIAAPGERQSRRYAELFVVALEGACGSHFGEQGSGPGLPREAGDFKDTAQATQNRSPAAEARKF